ncbi:hypothetical protein Sjap_024025 [Stephania japonica]|uniref:X8 domain-containing protein n=1 Tax=Stephania japonica TaxID=461633 RepID=A0AAP0EK04_9MAGN
MALLVALVALVILIMADQSDATYCVCRSDVSDAVLQKSLDYACGAGADCTQILQNGPCFQPNTVRAHCSYAVNSYFQRKGQVQGSCGFSNTAMTTESDPSTGNGCVYPSNPSTSTGNNTSLPPSILSPPGIGTTPPVGGGTGTGTGTGTPIGGGGLGGGGGGTLGPSASTFGSQGEKARSPPFVILSLLGFSGLLFLMCA